MRDALIVSVLSVLPQNALSRGMGTVARWLFPRALMTTFLRLYVWKYRVSLEEAALPLSSYPSLVAFFTRELRPGARPVDDGTTSVVSPVDGRCYQVGIVRQGMMFQGPGQPFPVAELLSEEGAASRFEGGAWCILYLSPRDYHRVHSPREGSVTRYLYQPGRLFPVFPAATRRVKHLFSRNERLVAFLSTDAGELAVVLVGAFGVGRIRMGFLSHPTQERGARRKEEGLPSPWAVPRGGEMGMFEMGSTVVLLFEPGRVSLTLREGDGVKMGMKIGEMRAPTQHFPVT